MAETLYDQIGRTYSSTRRDDPRIASAIHSRLGHARSIVNVGAGAGAYEPAGPDLVAIEPSWQMILQRSIGAAPVVRAVAEALPFRADTFEVAMAVLTLHHWTSWRTGLAEMKRVAKRVVLLVFDVDVLDGFWLTADYFPDIPVLDRKRSPSIDDIVGELGECAVDPVPVPHDCADGVLAAFWRRPEMYLDLGMRAGISAFAMLDEPAVMRGHARLEADLRSGAWDARYGHLRSLDAMDAGYRLLATPTHGHLRGR